MPGCVHLYCGDGKGKTTAAIGLAVRAAGRKKKVLIARFLKTDDSGEVILLKQIPEITVIPCEKSFGFFYQMTEQKKSEAREYYHELWEKVRSQAETLEYGMLVLDEIMAACRYGMVEEYAVIEFLKNRPPELEVVLTGRDPSAEFFKQADYVSEIQKKKHPYDSGQAAREGIEY